MPPEWLPWFALALTIVIEAPLLMLLVREDEIAMREALLIGIAMNCVTHPLAWQAIESWQMPWLGVEIAVVVVEMGILRLVLGLSWGRSLWIAGIINAITALIGLLIPWKSL